MIREETYESEDIVVVGSPRVGGNTDQLADAFMRGLRENNHSVKKIHLAKVKVNPCLGCEQCFRNGTPCVQKDDMNDILKDVEQADLIVLLALFISAILQHK